MSVFRLVSMPKRTNQFQQIVAYLAQQFAPLGAKLVEPAEVSEPNVSAPRELDTLIEFDMGLRCLRLALEVRDRTRRDHIGWIDELVGKYAELGVDGILAVSNSGFSKAAREKAAAHGIHLLSPTELRAIKWPAQFQRLGVASLKGEYSLRSVAFHTRPRFEGNVDPSDRVREEAPGGALAEGTVSQFIEEIGPILIARARPQLERRFLSVYRTLGDLARPAIIDGTFIPRGLTLLARDAEYAIEKVAYRVVVHGQRAIAPVTHRLLGRDALLSSAQVDEADVVIAQAANSSEGKAFFRRAKGRKRSRVRGPRKRSRRPPHTPS